MRFDIADLTLFIHIAESGSITGGAQRSHLALASASERVKNMEFRAGVSLLTRRPRGIGLTTAGDILLRHARRIVGEHDRLCAGLTAFAAGYGGTQRIYANTSAASWLLPGRIAAWLSAHPGALLEVEEKPSAEAVSCIAAGLGEAGLISDAVDAGDLIVEPVAADNLAVITADAHPLAGRSPLALREVVNMPFVGLESGSALQQYISARAAAAGHALIYRIRAGHFEGVCEMVGRGIGIAIVPEIQARLYARRFALRSMALSDGWARRSICLCYREWAALAPGMQALLGWIRAGASASQR